MGECVCCASLTWALGQTKTREWGSSDSLTFQAGFNFKVCVDKGRGKGSELREQVGSSKDHNQEQKHQPNTLIGPSDDMLPAFTVWVETLKSVGLLALLQPSQNVE